MIKREQKDERMAFRMSSKLRYGLGLVARRHRVSESEMICRAVELLLCDEGLLSGGGKSGVKLLDKLWSNNAAERALSLYQHAPDEFKTSEDQRLGYLLQEVRSAESVEGLTEWLKTFPYENLADIETIQQECELAELVARSNPSLAKRFRQKGSFFAWLRGVLPFSQ